MARTSVGRAPTAATPLPTPPTRGFPSITLELEPRRRVLLTRATRGGRCEPTAQKSTYTPIPSIHLCVPTSYLKVPDVINDRLHFCDARTVICLFTTPKLIQSTAAHDDKYQNKFTNAYIWLHTAQALRIFFKTSLFAKYRYHPGLRGLLTRACVSGTEFTTQASRSSRTASRR